jgi:RimJ/RimL family protein N-acetyltransferase
LLTWFLEPHKIHQKIMIDAKSMLPESIKTPRMILRRWVKADRDAFAKMNQDPDVMEFFPGLLSREESDAMVDRVEKHFDDHGFGFWAVELPGIVPFAGLIGLGHPRYETHFTPCVEIGWRMAKPYWGFGYATEGAFASLHFAFESLRLPEVVSMTAVSNMKSRNVMEKIGMITNPQEDFDHPLVPMDSPVCRHVLYRIHNPAMRDGLSG